MAPLRITGGPGIDCMTLHDGPPGLESQTDADAVIAPLCRAIRDVESETAGFVIACYSYRGLLSAREATAKPVCSASRNAKLFDQLVGVGLDPPYSMPGLSSA